MNVNKIRLDFPILQKEIKGKPIRYMDSACMSLRPRQVIEAIVDYYENYSACAGRSIHKLSYKVENSRQEARDYIKKFIGAKKPEEIIFTRNTTESINLIAHSIPFNNDDIILTTDREHNSNLIPWHLLSKKKGVNHIVVRSDEHYQFNMESFEKELTPKVKLVSFVSTSNLDGYTLPIEEIVKVAHDNNSLVMLDAAQTVPHQEVNVSKLGVDFLAFSGHKMLGPTGTGVLYVKEEHYDSLQPFMVGGDTVEWSTYNDHMFLEPPERFEAGLQNYAGEIGLGAAARYISSIGLGNVKKHEQNLTNKLHKGLIEIDAVINVGVANPELRGGITSFNINEINNHDVAMILNRNYNIMVRSGQHCVHSWFEANKIEGCVRASLYIYNTSEEIDTLLEGLLDVARLS